ncbi:hypothetical protein ACL9RI_10145 [Janthinobacterium sp. Mn2066]|uniref:hypothetical protein n=1 Tax=Janthinobacterium sp. Mn2066 TaxID=3395264 RepID=UPI003BC3CDCD
MKTPVTIFAIAGSLCAAILAANMPMLLREIVSTMSARVIDEACISLPLLGSGLDADGIAADPVLRQDLLAMLQRIKAIF